ncbi:bifunctional metallophosphatase/5'-nucleotidase [Bacillus weihaiensis]|uniref:Bifunctional metallophosphatase/5'-nucleotidase n=1 Tax=Bacillus weihaiensis TaxID=1547283 RepID=A0A1L3MNF0_9BACI|nr:bifunctional UDP-sugar hydrolase/5'-nucleotidase [Bacillus weihaiensis]APH03794.1 bifunctional metallophosphatase/5'-nucleotidase [Bacillus weihaiensis]
MLKTVHLYHTNDLHSHFENWPKIAHYVNEQRALHHQNKEEMILVDIGDHADRFHPITEATKGQVNVELLNQLNYDAVTIGNNEGITFSHEDLNMLYKEAKFPVIASNLYTEMGEHPEWIVPYHFITLEDGLKIALLGVTVFYEKFYELLGWRIKDPFQSLVETVNKVKEEADVIILLSHLGISDDEIIAKEFPDIDIIVGGHTHHVLQDGVVIGHSLVAGAGKYGQYVGKVTLTIDTIENKLVDKAATLLKIHDHQESCKETETFLLDAQLKSEEILSQKVAELKEEFVVDWFDDSNFPQLLVKAVNEWCKGEVAMLNAGLLLESLPKGPVTKKDLHRICPHPINPCKVYLKGDVLKEVIIQARTEKMEHLKLKGLGFRGKVMGRMVFDGIEVETDYLKDGHKLLTKIHINGRELDPERTYAVATIDMFTLGPIYPEISHAKKKEFFMPELLRDVLAWKLGKIPSQI